MQKVLLDDKYLVRFYTKAKIDSDECMTDCNNTRPHFETGVSHEIHYSMGYDNQNRTPTFKE